MIANCAQVIIRTFRTFPSNTNDWLLTAGITHGSIMLDAGGRAVQDAQVVGPGAAVVGRGSVVPHYHHLLGALEAPDRAHMALATVLLSPLPVRAAHHPGPDPFHHHPVIPGVAHRSPGGGLRRCRRSCRRGPREGAGPGPGSRRRRERQQAPGDVGIIHGGGGAVPAEPAAAPQSPPAPPRPPLGLEAGPQRVRGSGGRAEGRGPWAGTPPLPPGSPAGLQRRPPGNHALPRPGARGARGAQGAGGG